MKDKKSFQPEKEGFVRFGISEIEVRPDEVACKQTDEIVGRWQEAHRADADEIVGVWNHLRECPKEHENLNQSDIT